jgi:hypothetical protein
MYIAFKTLIDKIQSKEIKFQQKSESQVANQIMKLNEIVFKKNYDKLFHIYRAKIEHMIDEGYEATVIT